MEEGCRVATMARLHPRKGQNLRAIATGISLPNIKTTNVGSNCVMVGLALSDCFEAFLIAGVLERRRKQGKFLKEMSPKRRAASEQPETPEELPLGDDDLRLQVGGLTLNDRIEVTWRVSEDETHEASDVLVWTGEVVVGPRLGVGQEAGDMPKVDVLWEDGEYTGKCTKLPEEGVEYYKIKKLKRAARIQLHTVRPPQEPQQQQREPQQEQREPQQQQRGPQQEQREPQQQQQREPQQEQREPQLEQQQQGDLLLQKLQRAGLRVEDIPQIAEADWINLGFSIAEKIKLKTLSASRLNPSGRLQSLLGVAGRQAEEDILPETTQQISKVDALYYAGAAVDHVSEWRSKIAAALSTIRGPLPMQIAEELDYNYELMGTQETPGLQIVLERLMVLYLNILCRYPRKAQDSFAANLAKEKSRVATGLKKLVNYGQIMRTAIAVGDRRSFFQNRSWKTGVGSTFRQQQENRCRRCGQQFDGRWKDHAPHCPKLRMSRSRPPTPLASESD